jgi:hypothetical protein
MFRKGLHLNAYESLSMCYDRLELAGVVIQLLSSMMLNPSRLPPLALIHSLARYAANSAVVQPSAQSERKSDWQSLAILSITERLRVSQARVTE